MGNTPGRALSSVVSVRYRSSVEIKCTADCLAGYCFLITAGLLPWMACDMVFEIVDDTKLIPWFKSTLT